MDWYSSDEVGGFSWDENVTDPKTLAAKLGITVEEAKKRYKGKKFEYTDRKYGHRWYKEKGTIFFKMEDQGNAYAFMWNRVNSNGQPGRENEGLFTKNGVYVLDDKSK